MFHSSRKGFFGDVEHVGVDMNWKTSGLDEVFLAMPIMSLPSVSAGYCESEMLRTEGV